MFGAVAAGIPSFGDVSYKAPVRVATVSALAANGYSAGVLTATANGALAAIDGQVLALGDRVLVRNEATTSRNGIYTVTGLGSAGSKWTLTRATDCDVAGEMVQGLTVLVLQGTLLGFTVWYATAAWTPTSGDPAFGSNLVSSTVQHAIVTASAINGDGELDVLANGSGLAGVYLGTTAAGRQAGMELVSSTRLRLSAPAGAALTGIDLTATGVTGPTPTVQLFTASGTYTPPTGMLYCIVEAWGGGGGGGGCQATGVGQACSSGGGGGAGYGRKLLLSSVLAVSETVTIGGGGAGGNATPTAGAGGGNTSFATGKSYVVNAGGGGGGGAAPATGTSTRTAGGGGASPSSGADLAITGSDGGWGMVAAALGLPTGVGGGAAHGGGATGPSAVNAVGVAGAQYGGGGSGVFENASAAGFAGGAGKAGAVLVTEFYGP